MKLFKRFICLALCLAMLTSCAHREEERQNDLPKTVTVETFGTVAPMTETAPPETINTDKFIFSDTPETTAASERTAPASEKTEPITSSEAETEPSQEESGIEILPASGVMVANSSVNVREEPDPDSDRVGHLDKGDEVNITGIASNGWVRVVFKGGEYFVNGSYLSQRGETEATEATAAETTAKTTETERVSETSAPEIEVITETTAEPVTEPPETEYIEENLNVLTQRNRYTALNYSEQKAVWFAYLDIDGMLANADAQSFEASVSKAFDEVVSMGCNTVYVHVRSFGDSYYYSAYYPFTAAYSDTLGVIAPFDPLEIMISAAHSRGLSFHAWINPMRTTSKDRYAEMPSNYTLKKWYDSDATNGTFMVYDSDTGFYWLSPAYPAVRELICNGVAEIVSNYDVDGIHIDDYFYPTTSSSFDKAAFEVSGASDRSAWRRSVVNTLVREIYSTVKSCNSTVLFGVSPQGNIDNNLTSLYADVETWCSTYGYLDYIVPQIYYGFNDRLAFDAAAERWQSLVTLPNISLICGIAAYKVGVNSEWSSGSILSKQTDYIGGMNGYSGVAYYRHGSLFGSASSSEKLMQKELPQLIKSVSAF